MPLSSLYHHTIMGTDMKDWSNGTSTIDTEDEARSYVEWYLSEYYDDHFPPGKITAISRKVFTQCKGLSAECADNIVEDMA